MPFSFPTDFLPSLRSSSQWDEQAFTQAHEIQAPTSVRLNPFKPIKVFSNSARVEWNPQGRYLAQRPDFTLDPLFHAGAYYVQEASSMSILAALNLYKEPRSRLRILDLCAAPGGKSTLAASWLNHEGLLVANEVIKSRATILADNLSRWGISNVIVSNNDPREFGKLNHFFDIVIADVPCSGSGMFRKNPKATAEWSLEAVEMCSQRQQRILKDMWNCLRPGGMLIYSTCSFSSCENEEIVMSIIEAGDADYLEIPELESIPGIVSTGAGYRFLPHKIQGEGFFLAALRKTGEPHGSTAPIKEKAEIVPDIIPHSWLNPQSGTKTIKTHLGLSLIQEELIPAIAYLLKRLHIIKTGTLCGELRGKDFIPDHELALSSLLSHEVPRIELELPEALRFLKKEALPGRAGCSGRHLLCSQGLGIGWGNALPGRINNMLPKGWRILKELPAYT